MRRSVLWAVGTTIITAIPGLLYAQSLTLLSPSSGEVLYSRSQISVIGTVDVGTASVSVNGAPADLVPDINPGRLLFSAHVPLGSGEQVISVTAAGATLTIPITNLTAQAKELTPPVRTSFAGMAPRAVHFADYTRDGISDLAVVLSESAELALLRGTDDQAPLADVRVPVLPMPIDTLSADLNNDGLLDFIVTHDTGNGSSATLSTVLQQSGGTFVPGTLALEFTGHSALHTAPGDFNGDGFTDLAVALIGSGTTPSGLALYVGNSSGVFSFQRFYSFEQDEHPLSLHGADIDRDSDNDLLVGVSSSANPTARVHVFYNSANSGVFSPRIKSSFEIGAGPIIAADLNNDFTTDLIAASPLNRSVVHLINNGTGTFTPQPPRFSPVPVVSAMAADDFNDDGELDIVMTGFSDVPEERLPFNIAFMNSVSSASAAASVEAASAGVATDVDTMSLAVGKMSDVGRRSLAFLDGSSEELILFRTLVIAANCASLPLNLSARANSQCAVLRVAKPYLSRTALVTLTVDDADLADEGEMCIGSNCLTLFGDLASKKNRKKTGSLMFPVPAEWFKEGNNTITFSHKRSVGYTVSEVAVQFSIGRAADLDKFPLELSNKRSSQCFTMNIPSVPADARSLSFFMNALDANFSDEGELCIGKRCIELFGSYGVKSNQKRAGNASLYMPVDWFVAGDNLMCFKHKRTNGYAIQSLGASFSKEVVSSTVYPLVLQKKNPLECAVVNLDPVGMDTTLISLSVSAYDPDSRDEGKMCIGSNCLDLFGSNSSSKHNNKVRDFIYDTPRGWWQLGNNNICFHHTKAAGFKILDVKIAGTKNTPVAAPPVEVCRTLDFEVDSAGKAIRAGQSIENAYSDYGVAIQVKDKNGKARSSGIVFDTTNPNGADTALRTTSLKNVLVRAASTNDRNRDGYVDVPDSHKSGATFILKFKTPQLFKHLTLLDIGKKGGAAISFFNRKGKEIRSKLTPKAFGNGLIQKLSADVPEVSRLEIALKESGAVDDLVMCQETN